jgi:aryl-alcohol dehydrogenase-like predicted oxidoreductase
MNYSYLGRTGLKVSRIGLGTMNFGMETSEAESLAVLDAGINFVDTADVFGGPQSPDIKQGYGISEEYIGRWLAQDAGRRDKIVLATKLYQPTGTGPTDRGLSAYHIRKACEDSLRRLRTDHIDLYQMHHVDRSTPWEEIWQAMEQLVTAGKVIYLGSSNFAGWQIATAQGVAASRHFMAWYRSRASTTSPPAPSSGGHPCAAALRSGTRSVQSAGRRPHLGGALQKASQGRRADDRMRQRIQRLRPQLEAYDELCRELDETPADVALAWLLHQPAVTATIVGPRTADQLTRSLRAPAITLAEEALRGLDEIWPGPGGEAPEAYAW